MRRSMPLFLLLCFTQPVIGQPIEYFVDASDITRKIVHSHLKIPVSEGKVTLVYPKWIPGKHSPAGPIPDLVGLKIQANGKTIPWKRDELDGYAFHVQVPPQTKTLDVSVEYVASNSGIAKPKITPKLAVLEWEQYLLYPSGKNANDITFRTTVKLPDGWKIGGALRVIKQKENTHTFEEVSLTKLIDSPMASGEFFRKVRLAPDIEPPNYIVLVGDSAEAIELPKQLQQNYDRLIAEALALFGSHHYRDYHFLLSLSDHIPGGGLEHHECSDNRLPESALRSSSLRLLAASLLPHELIHSWNGKFRRPQSMIVKDFQQPHKTKLLWVYEGLTSYLDEVLATRAGFRSDKETRDYIALTAEKMKNQKGRSWRALEDTTSGAHVLYTAGSGWTSWRRSLDYYSEGMLIWLEVDAIIRRETDGMKSLDDFCRSFFAGPKGEIAVKGYTFESLTEALNAICPYQWETHFQRRVAIPTDQAPLEGIVLAGWKIAYSDTPTELFSLSESRRKIVDLSSSLGLVLKMDGTVADVIRGSAADKVKLGPGMKLVAVNSRRFDAGRLKSLLKNKGNTIKLLVENGEFFHTVSVPNDNGLQYPVLQRRSLSYPDLLGQILIPLTND